MNLAIYQYIFLHFNISIICMPMNIIMNLINSLILRLIESLLIDVFNCSSCLQSWNYIKKLLLSCFNCYQSKAHELWILKRLLGEIEFLEVVLHWCVKSISQLLKISWKIKKLKKAEIREKQNPPPLICLGLTNQPIKLCKPPWPQLG